MKRVTALFASPTARQLNVGLTVLRAVVGAVFVAHGAQKLFVFGFAGLTAAFAQMGVPMPGLVGPFIGFLELFGGLALIVGLVTRVAALGLASTMLVAILLVHLKAGFFLPNGIEYTLSLFGASIALVMTGAGAWSLDALVARRGADVASRIAPVTTRRAA